jgi:hypothetical protein
MRHLLSKDTEKIEVKNRDWRRIEVTRAVLFYIEIYLAQGLSILVSDACDMMLAIAVSHFQEGFTSPGARFGLTLLDGRQCKTLCQV